VEEKSKRRKKRKKKKKKIQKNISLKIVNVNAGRRKLAGWTELAQLQNIWN